jgi:hypothetical protein
MGSNKDFGRLEGRLLQGATTLKIEEKEELGFSDFRVGQASLYRSSCHIT